MTEAPAATPLLCRRLDSRAPDFAAALRDYLTEAAAPDPRLVAGVAEILADIRREGDAAVARHTARIDRATLTPAQFRLDPAELAAAWASLPAADQAAMDEAIAAVREFHQRGLPPSWQAENRHGALVGERYLPLARVGLYIPGGHVPLVSTVVMSAIPAQVAGVRDIVACTPPGPDGQVSPALLAAFYRCGITEAYRLGGPMAIGAMAFGTATIAPVVKIAGPGNAYVTEAKRQVFGTVGIDGLPGPSEVLALADATAHPAWLAADLLAQAEHGSGRERVVLVAPTVELVDAVDAELQAQLPQRRHAGAIARALRANGLAIVAPTLPEACAMADHIAPEHLELHVAPENEAAVVAAIRHAGAMFIGHHTPTVVGDFAAGPSHTLPTGRTARFLSGLRVDDFVRRTSLVRYSPEALRRAAPVVETFARLEQLDAHGHSLAIRLG